MKIQIKRTICLLICLSLCAGFTLLPVSAEDGMDNPEPMEEQENTEALEMDEAAVEIIPASDPESEDPDEPEEAVKCEETLEMEAEEAPAQEIHLEEEPDIELIDVVSKALEDHDEICGIEVPEPVSTNGLPDSIQDIPATDAGDRTRDELFSFLEIGMREKGYETQRVYSIGPDSICVILNDDYTISVDVPANAFSESVVFFVGLQSWDSLSAEDLEMLSVEGITRETDPVLFDIGFTDCFGREIEPAFPVSLVISAKAAPDPAPSGGLSIQVDAEDGENISMEAQPQEQDFKTSGSSQTIEIDVYHINESSGPRGENTLDIVASTDTSRLTVNTAAEEAGTVVIEDGIAVATIEASSFSLYVVRVNMNRAASVSDGTTIMLNPNSSVVLRVYDDGGNAITSGITWRSSNTSAVTITSSGILRSVGVGNATITATIGGETLTVYVASSNNGTYAMYDSSRAALIFFQSATTPTVGTTFSHNGTTFTASEIYSGFETLAAVPWSSHRAEIKTVVFGGIVSPISMANWFSGCSSLTEISRTEWVNTSSVTSMYHLFNGCSKLTSLDLHTWDTSKVTDMAGMLAGCSALTSLNLTGWDTAQVTTMADMFMSCGALTALNVSSFNTYKVTNMSRMFWGCTGLTSLNLNNFYTINVTTMYGMFANCDALATIYMSYSDFFITSAVTDMSSMFYGCLALKTIQGNLSNFNTANVTDMSLMFYNCRVLETVDASGWNVGNVTNMKDMFGQCRALTTVDVSGWSPSNVTNTSAMFYYCTSLTEIDLRRWYTRSLEDASWMFGYCFSLSQADLRGFARSGLKNVSYMFYGCSGLKALHMGNWDTSGITTWTSAFTGLRCNSLNTDKSISLIAGSDFTAGCYIIPVKTFASYDTAKNTLVFSNNEPSELIDFSGVKVLTYTGRDLAAGDTVTYQDVSYAVDEVWTGFDTTAGYHPWTSKYSETMTEVVMAGSVSPISLNSWFKNCTALKTVDVFRMNTSQTSDMSSMFYGCTSLTSVSSAVVLCNQVNQVTSMYSMFYNCSSLTDLKLRNSSGTMYWKTGTIKNMANMFYGCTNLKAIEGLEFFDTSNVTEMTWMFGRCTSLTDVDLSSFNTSKLSSLDYMFFNCTALSCLNLSAFQTASISSMKQTFSGCSALKYLDLSGWNTAAVTEWDRAFYRVSSNTLSSNASITLSETPTGSITSGLYIVPQKVYAVYDSNNQALVLLRSLSVEIRDGIYSYPAPAVGERFSYGGVTYAVANVYPNVETLTTVPWPAETRAAITSVVFAAQVRPVSTAGWFNGCTELTQIINLNYLNTSDVTTMNSMFRECSAIKDLDLSGFHTEKVTNMQSMFYQCGNLESVNLSSFNTEAVTTMGWMFYQCPKLSNLDLSGFRTGSVTSMKSMFVNDISLQNLDLSGFNMGNVENISYMLRNCTGLRTLDLSEWNTSSVSEWTSAFENVSCTVLSSDKTKELAMGENFIPGLYIPPVTEIFSVSVPAALTVYLDENGSVHTASNAVVVNNSTGAVQVTDIAIQEIAGSGWTFSEGLKSGQAPVNARVYSLSVAPIGEIASDGSKPVSYSAVIPTQSEAVDTANIAQVIFTIAWAGNPV